MAWRIYCLCIWLQICEKVGIYKKGCPGIFGAALFLLRQGGGSKNYSLCVRGSGMGMAEGEVNLPGWAARNGAKTARKIAQKKPRDSHLTAKQY